MNPYKQQLLELSTELYQRAADKAKKYQRGAGRMSKGHVQNAIKRGEHDTVINQARKRKGTSMEGEMSTTNLPNLDLSTKYDDLRKERKQQVGKFSAAAKGVKSKRPHRGYPLGSQQANLVKQSQIQLNREKREDENIMNNFEKSLARKLMEMRKGPDDKTYDPDDPKGTRSIGKQHKRNVFAGELKRHRTEVQALQKPKDSFTKKGSEEDIEATGKNLKKMKRKSGEDPIPDFTKAAQNQEFRHVPRGRVATTGGGRTDPSQRGEEDAEAYQQRAQGEGEASQTQKQVAGQAADVSKDKARRSRDTESGHGAKKTRRADMKKKATKIRARVRKQGQTSYSDLKDPDAAEVAGTRGRKPPRDIGEHFQSVLTQALVLNEVGDTERGKEFIGRAYNKRARQIATAQETSTDLVRKHGAAGAPDSKTSRRMSRGVLQMQKVGGYMGGRLEGEDLAKTVPHPKAQEVLKSALGDIGAKAGREEYDNEYKETEQNLKKRSKKEKETTSQGVRRGLRQLGQQSRALNWNQGMPPGQSSN